MRNVTFDEVQDATEIANDRNRVLQFAIAPSRNPHPLGNAKFGPVKQSLASTRDGALSRMKQGILHIQRKKEDKQMAYLQRATERILEAAGKWTEVSTA